MPAKSVLYICHGNFNYLSRAKRQINALIENGYKVTVANGLFSGNPEYDYPYEILKFRIKTGKSPMLNFLSLIWFNISLGFKVKDKYNVIICRELSILLSGVIMKLLKGSKLVFDSNELSVETHSGIKKIVWNIIQRFSIQFCNLIIHAEQNRMNYFKEKYRVINGKSNQIVIENYPYLNSDSTTIKPNGLKAVYFGGLSEGRSIEEIIIAFKSIENVALEFIGFGDESYKKKLKHVIIDKKINNVKFREPINDEKIYDFLSAYHIGFAFYDNTNLNNYYCAPNKIFQYIQAGMSVITNDYPGLKPIVEGNCIGNCVSEVSSTQISEAVTSIVSKKMWENCTLNLKENFCWEKIEKRFLEKVNFN